VIARRALPFPGLLLFVFPGSLLLLFPASGGAHPTVGYGIAMTSHGVELSLLLARRIYPRNALVSTTITVRNVSKHVVRLTTFPSINGSQGPQVSVLDARGNVVYPPALQKLFGRPNPFPGQLRLRPGDAYQTQMYVILRAAHLEAEALVQDPSRRTIRTRVLRLRLMASKSPQVSLHIVAGSTYAEVHPMVAVRGPLLYMSAAKCAPLETEFQVLDWTAARGTRLVSGCRSLIEWHAIAGWSNRPVAVINYVRS
jgi:hypothetical protein